MSSSARAQTTLESAIVSDARARGLTPEYIESRIADVRYYVPDEYGGTLCLVKMVNGHIVHGQSSCPNEEDGQALAYTDALNRIWELERFLVCENRYQRGIEKALELVSMEHVGAKQ